MSSKTKFYLGIALALLVLLYFFPITTIIIGVVLIILWNSDGGDYGKGSRNSRWIKPYIKKDGTIVEGHWKTK